MSTASGKIDGRQSRSMLKKNRMEMKVIMDGRADPQSEKSKLQMAAQGTVAGGPQASGC